MGQMQMLSAELRVQETILEENLVDIGKDGRRHHTWPFNERDLGFEDIIVVSDEYPPPPSEDGKSYTLWTTAHEENNLVIDGKRRMSHKPHLENFA